MIIKQDGNYSHVFSRYREPVAHVNPGTEVTLYTQDAFSGAIKNTDDFPSKVLNEFTNPQTGPIFINGAQPGDTLVVDIIEIEPTRDWAASCVQFNAGGLTPTRFTPMISDHLPEKVWIYKFNDKGELESIENSKMCFPWEPFLGTFATSPDYEVISTPYPFNQGGNMDVPDVKPGNKVYLPVKVEGGLFYTGDCHANQGQGEVCGAALEITAKVKLKFDIIKNKKIYWPRIESKDEFMVVGSGRPMEDAARIAYSELLNWMCEDYGWNKLDAYQTLSIAGKLYVGNMVNPSYSMVAKLSKEIMKRNMN